MATVCLALFVALTVIKLAVPFAVARRRRRRAPGSTALVLGSIVAFPSAQLASSTCEEQPPMRLAA